MKFAAALSLVLAPVALANAVQDSNPVRRESNKNEKNNKSGGGSSNSGIDAALLSKTGLTLGSLNEVVFIWVNSGGGAATTTINNVQTVTQTVTAGGAGSTAAAGAPPPPPPPPPPPGTTVAAAAGGGSTATAAAALTTHTVTVGGPKGLLYEPSSIQANVGDMVVFSFLSQNHTVSQSAFATPCKLLAGGMDSGFQPNANNSVNPPPQVAMQVMVNTPLWFYCRQQGHCGKGMVFSINPTAAKTQSMFQQMAISQNGTGTASTITGGSSGGSGSSSGSTGSGSGGSGSGGSGSTAATTAAAPPSVTGSASSAAGTGVTKGSGSVNPDGSCSCVVQCAFGSFPAVQAQGVGSFGGMAGTLPMSAIAA